MKASKLKDAHKAFVIKQGEDGTPISKVCCKAGVSQATYFSTKKKYAGLMPSEMPQSRELEDDNMPLCLRSTSASAFSRCPCSRDQSLQALKAKGCQQRSCDGNCQ